MPHAYSHWTVCVQVQVQVQHHSVCVCDMSVRNKPVRRGRSKHTKTQNKRRQETLHMEKPEHACSKIWWSAFTFFFSLFYSILFFLSISLFSSPFHSHFLHPTALCSFQLKQQINSFYATVKVVRSLGSRERERQMQRQREESKTNIHSCHWWKGERENVEWIELRAEKEHQTEGVGESCISHSI